MRSVSPSRGLPLLSALLLAASVVLAQEPPAPPAPEKKQTGPARFDMRHERRA